MNVIGIIQICASTTQLIDRSIYYNQPDWAFDRERRGPNRPTSAGEGFCAEKRGQLPHHHLPMRKLETNETGQNEVAYNYDLSDLLFSTVA
jgi:hypothetical protein